VQLGTLASELQGKYCRCDLQQPNNNLFLYQRVINIVSNLGNLFISIHSFVPNRMSSIFISMINGIKKESVNTNQVRKN